MAYTDNPDIVVLTGNDLVAVINAFTAIPHPNLVLVWLDEGGLKLKFNQHTWSPPLGHLDAD